MCNCVEGNAWKSALTVSLIASVREGTEGRCLGLQCSLCVWKWVTVFLSQALPPLLRCSIAIKQQQWNGDEMQSKIDRKQF